MHTTLHKWKELLPVCLFTLLLLILVVVLRPRSIISLTGGSVDDSSVTEGIIIRMSFDPASSGTVRTEDPAELKKAVALLQSAKVRLRGFGSDVLYEGAAPYHFLLYCGTNISADLIITDDGRIFADGRVYRMVDGGTADIVQTLEGFWTHWTREELDSAS